MSEGAGIVNHLYGGVFMTDRKLSDYKRFDRPEILSVLFHPRKEPEFLSWPENVHHLLIPVEPEVTVGAALHVSSAEAPVILFFHGNGEIVADYNEIGFFYSQEGVNFLPIDYRGYGRSSGQATVSAIMKDSHTIFDFCCNWLAEHGFCGKLAVMGRSLGSACALEIAATREKDIDGLIIESGFAQVLPLLRLLGIAPSSFGLVEEKGFRNLDKISDYNKPLLVIHGEYDHIIPYAEGQALFSACPSSRKAFLQIDRADHNTILYFGLDEYLAGVKMFLEELNQ